MVDIDDLFKIIKNKDSKPSDVEQWMIKLQAYIKTPAGLRHTEYYSRVFWLRYGSTVGNRNEFNIFEKVIKKKRLDLLPAVIKAFVKLEDSHEYFKNILNHRKFPITNLILFSLQCLKNIDEFINTVDVLHTTLREVQQTHPTSILFVKLKYHFFDCTLLPLALERKSLAILRKILAIRQSLSIKPGETKELVKVNISFSINQEKIKNDLVAVDITANTDKTFKEHEEQYSSLPIENIGFKAKDFFRAIELQFYSAIDFMFLDKNWDVIVDGSLLKAAILGFEKLDQTQKAVWINKILQHPGSDPNKADENLQRPLHHVISLSQEIPGIVELLIKRGAQVECGDNESLSPIDMAIRKGYHNILKLLMDGRTEGNKRIFNQLEQNNGLLQRFEPALNSDIQYKLFAHINLDHALKGSPMQGAQPSKTSGYLLSQLRSPALSVILQNISHHYTLPNNRNEQLKSKMKLFKRKLEKLHQFCLLAADIQTQNPFPPVENRKYDNEGHIDWEDWKRQTKERKELLIAPLIKKILEETGLIENPNLEIEEFLWPKEAGDFDECLFLGGFSGREGGHTMIYGLKILNTGDLQLTIYNTGGGLSFHPNSEEVNKQKRHSGLSFIIPKIQDNQAKSNGIENHKLFVQRITIFLESILIRRFEPIWENYEYSAGQLYEQILTALHILVPRSKWGAEIRNIVTRYARQKNKLEHDAEFSEDENEGDDENEYILKVNKDKENKNSKDGKDTLTHLETSVDENGIVKIKIILTELNKPTDALKERKSDLNLKSNIEIKTAKDNEREKITAKPSTPYQNLKSNPLSADIPMIMGQRSGTCAWKAIELMLKITLSDPVLVKVIKFELHLQSLLEFYIKCMHNDTLKEAHVQFGIMETIQNLTRLFHIKLTASKLQCKDFDKSPNYQHHISMVFNTMISGLKQAEVSNREKLKASLPKASDAELQAIKTQKGMCEFISQFGLNSKTFDTRYIEPQNLNLITSTLLNISVNCSPLIFLLLL